MRDASARQWSLNRWLPLSALPLPLPPLLTALPPPLLPVAQLSHNALTGNLPYSWGDAAASDYRMSHLVTLDLSANELWGDVEVTTFHTGGMWSLQHL